MTFIKTLTKFGSLTTLLLAVAAAGGFGEPEAKTGTISITVLDAQNQAIQSATVELAQGGLHVAGGTSDPQQAKSAGRGLTVMQEATVLTKATTDKDGKAEFTKLKPGKYRASTSGSDGNINAFATLKVEAGKTIKATLRPTSTPK